VNWDGSIEHPSTDISTEAESLVWSEVDFTWDDLQLISKAGRYRRKKTLDDYLIKHPEDKKRLIRLICKVKGITVYDEQKAVSSGKIDVKDIDFLIEEVEKRMIIQ
jgi:hypothetical protein